MPTCEAASVLPDPTGTASPLTALPDGVRGAAVFNVFEIGRCDFKHGQTPALNKVIAYSLQGAWSDPKPESENFPFEVAERFFARLKNPRHQSGYQLPLRESIYLTPEPTAAAASGATLPPVSCISEPYFKSFLDHLVKVARQLAHHGQGNLRAHATAAFRALTSEPVQTLGVVRLYHAARLAAGGEGTDTQDPAILGQMGEFLEVCRLRKELGPTAIIEWLNVDFEMGKPFDILWCATQSSTETERPATRRSRWTSRWPASRRTSTRRAPMLRSPMRRASSRSSSVSPTTRCASGARRPSKARDGGSCGSSCRR